MHDGCSRQAEPQKKPAREDLSRNGEIRVTANVDVWISVLALVISFYALYYTRRATAAGEQRVAIQRDREREVWVLELSGALPDPQRVEAVLADLPDRLRPAWEALVRSALRRNQRTPDAMAEAMMAKHHTAWKKAALGEATPKE